MARHRVRLAPRWQGTAVCAAVALTLAGCAHTPDWVPWHKAEAAQTAQQQPAPEPPHEETHRRKPTRSAPRKAEVPATAAEPQVAMVDPNALVGMKPPAVTRLLGPPANTTKDEMSLVWTYAADGCVMRIYFYPDLKTADFHVLKFTLADADGKPLADEAPCRRKLLAQRANDTG